MSENLRKIVLPNEVLLSSVADLLSEGKDVVLMTKGSSMNPFIRGEKDSVRLRRQDSYAIGDIVLVKIRDNNWVLHRLIGVDGTKALLKGDGNLDQTESCMLDDVRGKAVAIVRPSGREIDCCTASFIRRSSRWRGLPRIIRRIYLGFYRRLV